MSDEAPETAPPEGSERPTAAWPPAPTESICGIPIIVSDRVPRGWLLMMTEKECVFVLDVGESP